MIPGFCKPALVPQHPQACCAWEEAELFLGKEHGHTPLPLAPALAWLKGPAGAPWWHHGLWQSELFPGQMFSIPFCSFKIMQFSLIFGVKALG